MTIHFNFEEIEAIEFGVGRDLEGGRAFASVMADQNVQTALREMAEATWQAMSRIEGGSTPYQPSEKYSSNEYLTLTIEDENATALRELHQAVNLPINTSALDEAEAMFCYFARFSDVRGRHLTAVRRSTQFKGVLKSRLVSFITDALQIIEDKVFKLDNDFDLLIDDNTVHILRPTGFEFVGQLQDAILAAVPRNIAVIRRELNFVDFAPVAEYAIRHPRAARYLASIRTLDEFKNIDRRALKSLCERTNVAVTNSGDKMVVEDGHIMGFLEVLDRRRFAIALVRDAPERYRAPSRRKLGA